MTSQSYDDGIVLPAPLYAEGQPGYVHKFQRAVTHLNAITSEAGPFIESGLHRSGEAELKREQEWTVIRWGALKPIPGAWPLYLGDFLTNARATLDHLIFDLVRANNRDPGHHTAFPICDTSGKWKIDVVERVPENGPSPIEGVAECVVKLIRSHQPFCKGTPKTRENHPLMHLLLMSNADKHRTLHATTLTTGKLSNLTIVPRGFAKIIKKRVMPAGEPIKRGGEIARIKADPIPGTDQGTQLYIHYQTPAQVTFTEGGKKRKSTIEDLYGIVNSITKIGEQLEVHTKSGSTWFADVRARIP